VGYEILKKLIDNVRNGINIFIEEDRIVMEYDESICIKLNNEEWDYLKCKFYDYMQDKRIFVVDYTLNKEEQK
jgi:hypothetical protein